MIQKLNRSTLFLSVFSIIIIFALSLGFYNFGSPAKQALVQETSITISEINMIYNSVNDYIVKNKKFPESLDDLNLKSQLVYSGALRREIDLTKYSFKLISSEDMYVYQICTINFPMNYKEFLKYQYSMYPVDISRENAFEQGPGCLTFEFRPENYPELRMPENAVPLTNIE